MEWFQGVVSVVRELLTLARPFAPYATAVAALLAGAVALRTHQHRRIADNRAEWWRRAQFALELTLSDDDKVDRNVGMSLLTHVLTDRSSTKQDAEMLKSVVNTLIDEVTSQDAEPPAKADGESRKPGRIRSMMRRRNR